MSSSAKNLENLVRAKLLKPEPTSKQEITRLLAPAEEQLHDSRAASLSASSKFALAYNAAHALALTALRAEGYRPSTSMGHRKIVFQVLEPRLARNLSSGALWIGTMIEGMQPSTKARHPRPMPKQKTQLSSQASFNDLCWLG